MVGEKYDFFGFTGVWKYAFGGEGVGVETSYFGERMMGRGSGEGVAAYARKAGGLST